MDIIDTSRTQTAVYWAPKGVDDYGNTTFYDPRELNPDGDTGGVRWDDTTERITNGKGVEVRSRARVAVGEDVEEDGVLRLGTLESIPQEKRRKPFANKGAYAIQRFDKIPTLDGEQFYRVAFL